MFYFILVLIFIAVFSFIGWRVWKSQIPPVRTDQYVCPRCNALDCDCHKREQ